MRMIAVFAAAPANGVTMNTLHDRPSTPSPRGSQPWKCVVGVDRGRVGMRRTASYFAYDIVGALDATRRA